MQDSDSDRLRKLRDRISELNKKFSQTLMFLAFALVVIVTLKRTCGPSQQGMLSHVAAWWSFSLFPALLGILPVKEFKEDSETWYEFVRWLKVVLLWLTVASIFVGAILFFHAIACGTL